MPTTALRPTRRAQAVLAIIGVLLTVTAFDSADLGLSDPSSAASLAQAPGNTMVGLLQVGSFEAPVEVIPGPGPRDTFVVQQGGQILRVGEGARSVQLDISDTTGVSGERGLLGAAYHPTEPLLYVHYSDDSGDSVIAEYRVEPDTLIGSEASERLVLHVDQPFENHNGGEIAFGPDGFLYIGFGDGGFGGDPGRVALDLTSPLGKILRIDPTAADGEPFTIPADNPFATTQGAHTAIWSIGLRNPWKFSFDSHTADLWIADVGENQYEEINHAQATAGQNAGRGTSFGWSAFEGRERFNADQSADGHQEPLLAYARDDGACSVSGGAVYRGVEIPELFGFYVFGDYCTGSVWAIDPADPAPSRIELAQVEALVAIAEGGDGELYAVSNNGPVLQLVASAGS